jgi:outer membrane receptor protein involved in Fe transport
MNTPNNNPKTMNLTQTRRWFALAIMGLFSTSLLFGQAASSEGTQEEQTFELDPFTVTTTDDRGYYSANSTSITRINEEVKNTPISMTVINEQLLEDLGSLNDHDLEQATSSISKDPDGFSYNQIRIRGFRSFTQRYDLFYREIIRDFYNIQRVDIVKGANSLMYGQADPGGQVNAVPKKAAFGKNFYNFNLGLGNKNYHRFVFDANLVASNTLAFRVMGMDYAQELDQLYAERELRGATLEAAYRPYKGTNLRLHLEHIEAKLAIPRRMFVDATGDKIFRPNSQRWENDLLGTGNPYITQTLTAYKFEYIYSPDAVKFLPDGLISDLRLRDQDPDYVPTREDIEAIYAAWAPRDEMYSVTGPDAMTDRSGNIITLELSQRITPNLKFNIAYNRESNDRDAIDRNGYTSTRVRAGKFDSTGVQIPESQESNYPDIPYEPYIATFWQHHTDDTTIDAVKSTLLWDLEFLDTPIFGRNKHTLLMGIDYDRLRKSPISEDQLISGTELFPGSYAFDNLDATRRTITEINQNNFDENFYYFNDQQHVDTFRLGDGFRPDVPNVRFNGRYEDFYPREIASSDVKTEGYWAALQSQFFNGRLRTLLGVRHDSIDITHSYQKNVVWINKNRFEASWARNPDDSHISISDLNRVIQFNGVNYNQTSPSLGGLFWLTDEWGIFGNYAKSIQSPTGVTVDPFGDVVPPVYGEGYEYGLRFQLLSGKVNGQISAFYIEKENDNIVNYDFLLGQIITYEEYGDIFPEYFIWQPGWPGGGRYFLEQQALPSRQLAGDMSRAEGVDVEFYFNPTRNLSMVFSYTYNNLDAIRIHPKVQDLMRITQVYGVAPHNVSIHYRYKHNDGPLEGLTWGISQTWRSKSNIRSYYIDDQDKWYDVEFDEEFTTSGFLHYSIELKNSRIGLTYRINNLFNGDEIRNRSRTAFYQESTQHKFEFGWYF